MMALNFIGLPLFLLLILAVIGIITGLLKKSKNMTICFLIVLIVIITFYLIRGLLF